MLIIRASATAVAGKGIVETTTKTKRDRHVPVPEPVWERLRWAFDNARKGVGIEPWFRTA